MNKKTNTKNTFKFAGVTLFFIVMLVYTVATTTQITDTSITVGNQQVKASLCIVDKSTSNFDTLQECINQVGSNGEIKVREGVYSITTPINIHAKQNLTITGSQGVIMQAAAGLSGNNLFNITSSENIKVSGIKFDGNNYTNYILFAWYNKNLKINDVTFYDPTSDANGAIEFYNVTELDFSNNYIENTWIVNIFGYSNNIVFANNICKNNYDSCISIGSSTADAMVDTFAITGNVFSKATTSTGYAVDMFGLVQNGVVSGNTMEGKGIIVNVDTYNPRFISITGNVLNNVNANAVSTEQGAEYITIVGNVVYGTDALYSDFNLQANNGTFIGNFFNSSKLSITATNLSRGHNADSSHSGFVSLGNIELGANLLTTTNHALKDGGSYLAVRTSNDAGYSSMQMQNAQISGNIIGGSNQIYGFSNINASAFYDDGALLASFSTFSTYVNKTDEYSLLSTYLNTTTATSTYVDVSGDTMTGNLSMGANLLKTTNHALKDGGTYLAVRTSNDAGYSSMEMQNAKISGNIIGGGNQIYGFTNLNITDDINLQLGSAVKLNATSNSDNIWMNASGCIVIQGATSTFAVC